MMNREQAKFALRLRSYGVVMEFRTNRGRLLERMVAHLPPSWRESSAKADVVFTLVEGRKGAERYQLFRDDLRLGRLESLEMLLSGFESDVQLYVAEMSPHRVFVHAGVVGWRGSAIVIPGRSYSGKTTLVHQLVKEGATYYSDEYAVLDERGRVHPYARPLAVRRDGKTVKVSAASISPRVGRQPLPVGLVVVSQYRQSGRWRPKELSTGAGALELLNNTVPARRKPENVMRVIGEVVSHAVIIKSVRGEVEDTARLVLRYLEERA
jgi:hypothetical protein